MQPWLIWMSLGIALMVAELIVPGGIVVFLGISAMVVSLAIYVGWISSITYALLTWFITSIIFMLFLRSLFMKYFEGDSQVHNVDDNSGIPGKVVEVIEDIAPDKSGRVRMRDSTWVAKSEENFKIGDKAIVVSIEENILTIKSN